MKAFAVFAILAVIVALTEASALKMSNKSMLKYSCDIDGIKADVAELINISYDAKDKLVNDAFSIYGGVMNCVHNFNMDFINCVETSVQTGVTNMHNDAQDYVNQARALADNVVQEVQSCFQI